MSQEKSPHSNPKRILEVLRSMRKSNAEPTCRVRHKSVVPMDETALWRRAHIWQRQRYGRWYQLNCIVCSGITSRDCDGTGYCMLPAVVSVCPVLWGFKEFRAACKLSKYKHYRSLLLIYSPIYDDGSELRPRRAWGCNREVMSTGR
jgi:hypothetical protein